MNKKILFSTICLFLVFGLYQFANSSYYRAFWGDIQGDINNQDDLIGLFTDYFKLSGRSGGQVASGGTDASDNLTLQSTSNATKGKILFGANSVYDEVNDRLGIGTTNPNYSLVVGQDLGTGFANAAMSVTNGPGKSVSLIVGSSNQKLIEMLWDESNSKALFNSAGTSPFAFSINGDEKMRLIANGDLGINQPSPTARTHIKGSTSDSSAYALKVDDSSDASLFSVRNDGQILQNELQAFADNTIIVNSVNDLPTPTDLGDGLGTAYRLENGKEYLITNNISISSPIAPSGAGDSSGLKFVWDKYLTYTGTGAMFRSNTTNNWVNFLIEDGGISGNGTNTFLDIDGDGTQSFFVKFAIIDNFADLGTVDNHFLFDLDDSTISDFDSGITLNEVEEELLRGDSAWIPSASMTGAAITINGTGATDSATIDGANVYLQNSNQNAFDIKSTYAGVYKISHAFIDTSLGGIPYASGSKDEKDVNGDVFSNIGIPDSQIIGSIFMERNTTVTNPTVQGSDGIITAFADAGGGQVTVTSAGHGLANGAVVWIAQSTNYLNKYTISNVATDTFEITETYVAETPLSGTAWETGWTKVAGTTVEKDVQRSSQTANNQITFENLEEKILQITVTTNPQNDTISAAKEWEFCIMKNGVERISPPKYREMTNKAAEGNISTTSSVIDNDYFEVYTRNLSDTTTDMIMVNMSMVIE